MPPKKTVSFKGETKRSPNWFQRQFSGQMSHSDYSSDGEFAATIAAAAYAINSLEEEESMKQKSFERLESPLSRTKSKKEESILKRTNSSKISRWFSGKESKEDGKSVGDISLRKSSTFDKKMVEENIPDSRQPEKAMSTTPSTKKTPTFSDKYLNDTGSRRNGGGKEIEAPVAYSSDKEKYHGYSSGYNIEADVWENAKMDKIKKRYEKANATILEWEDEKKTKAKRRLERKEQGALEMEKAKALQEYRDEIRRIDKIAGGARAVANERKRNEELKVLEKAKVIRATGKVPSKCSCF